MTESQRTSEDVTTKYYDIKTRLKALEAERDSLTKMLSEATDLDYILKVQSKLYDVIYQIETHTATLKQYEVLTNFATVNLRLCEVIEYTPTVEKGYFTRLWESFKDGWVAFGEGCADFSIGFVGGIPTLLLLAAIVAVVVVIVRKFLNKRKKKKEKE